MDWSSELDKVGAKIDRVLKSFELLGRYLISHEGRSEIERHGGLPNLLDEIHKDLREIENISSNLRWRLIRTPQDKLVMGLWLTKDDYYLLKAQEIINDNDYDAFMHRFYIADDRHGYIFESVSPRPSKEEFIGEDGHKHITVRAGIAGLISPEEVKTSQLMPDQREFLEKNYPEMYARFKKG